MNDLPVDFGVVSDGSGRERRGLATQADPKQLSKYEENRSLRSPGFKPQGPKIIKPLYTQAYGRRGGS